MWELTAQKGCMVDMHCDELDDPHSRHIESLCFETRRLGLQGRVTGSHPENYGLHPGCHANMVVLQVSSKQEAIRLRPARLFVIPRGRVISQMPETVAKVNLGTGDIDVDFCI
ncbi:MAG: hypothetical protein RBR67_10310 [Desulfobacterium sp.]|jgi:cytosine/adenosine deaminase-related metal-dependent hydrolase|nr:hypothetical protein [Desulfobacterium sp.]